MDYIVLTFNKYNIHILHITHAHTYHTRPSLRLSAHNTILYIYLQLSLYFFQISMITYPCSRFVFKKPQRNLKSQKFQSVITNK